MESIAIYVIYLESIVLKYLVSQFSSPYHSSTAEDVLHPTYLDVVKFFTGLAMQAEIELKTAENWFFVDPHIFQLKLGQLRAESCLEFRGSCCIELPKGRMRDTEAIACEFGLCFGIEVSD